MKVPLHDIFEEELGISDINDPEQIRNIPDEKIQRALEIAQYRVDKVNELLAAREKKTE